MQIQINTDENIDGGEKLSARISAQIRERLDRFSQHITRIEVHLSDSNADKSGDSDKRCLIEVRLEGRQPEVVSDKAATLESAYSGAINKLQRALESTLGKLNQHKGADTIRTGGH
ncbi:MAG: HPF/RaiA family ribosome-associated protein [Sneathiella sp.]|nr:HPF/RaiA family ribosome-associated protein [Sneathiella sp.]